MGNSQMEVNLEALERVLRLGGPSLLDRLIATGLGNLGDRFRELYQAADQVNWQDGQRAAHSIKGSCLYLGLDSLAHAAAEIEKAAAEQQADWPTAARALDASLIDQARVALADARARLLP